jgi:hypothetical protein
MYKYYPVLIVSLGCFWSACQEGSVSPDLTEALYFVRNYPYTLYAKSGEEIDQLQSQFDQLNGGKICTRLNVFGLTGESEICIPETPDNDISNQTAMIRIAKTSLLRNMLFTNVADTTQLKIRQILDINASPTERRITFDEQVYHGFSVDQSNIVVFYYGDYIYRIDGCWYRDIPVPEKLPLNASDAKEKLIGLQFDFYCWNVIHITVTRESILDDLTAKYIFPVKNEESIAFRFSYRFSVRFGNDPNPEFQIYVDGVTGEVIKIRSLIVC